MAPMSAKKVVGFPKSKEIDKAIVKRLLMVERDAHDQRKSYLRDGHLMIQFSIGRGMSRVTAERIWGRDMVKDALDSEGIQTIAAE